MIRKALFGILISILSTNVLCQMTILDIQTNVVVLDALHAFYEGDIKPAERQGI